MGIKVSIDFLFNYSKCIFSITFYLDDEGEDEEETNADFDEGFIFMTFFIF